LPSGPPFRLGTVERLNCQFHSILYSRANQPRFMAIIRNVNNRNGTRDCSCTKRANEEHHQMLELCRKRDVAGASTLLREHILYADESLKQALELKRTSARVNSRNGKSRSKS